jgi:hypothetical protein
MLRRPYRLEQGQFLHGLRAEMRYLGVELKTVSAGEYSPTRPFDQIRDVMSSCRAALIVGLERSRAYTVFDEPFVDPPCCFGKHA